MALVPISEQNPKTKLKAKTVTDKTVNRGFTIKQSLVDRVEDFRFKHRKSSFSQIVQEAITFYLDKHEE